MSPRLRPRRLFPLLTGLLAVGLLASAGTAGTVKKTTLFVSGEAGYAGYRIPALVTTPQQTVLAAAEARKYDRSDWGHIDIYLRRSTDSGRTWEPARLLIGQNDLPPDVTPNPAEYANTKPQGLTLNNPTWVTDARSGKTLLLFCAEYMRAFVIESTDGGATFSKPREITSAFEAFRSRDGYAWRVIATGPGHGIQTTTGRLIVPVWLSTSTGDNAHHPSVCATIYSDDGGATWHAGEIAAGHDDDVRDPSETIVAETAPGRIMLNIRNESPHNRRAAVWSQDGATRWTHPIYIEDLWEPVCMGSITKLANGTLVFANPATLRPQARRPESLSRQRENLGLRISVDQGRRWSAPLVIEPGPSAYSDLAVAPDGTVLCFYEQGEKEPYEKMTVARIPAELLSSLRP